MVQSVLLLRLRARGECHQCDAPCPTHSQRRLGNGSLRPAKSAPIIYSQPNGEVLAHVSPRGETRLHGWGGRTRTRKCRVRSLLANFGSVVATSQVHNSCLANPRISEFES